MSVEAVVVTEVPVEAATAVVEEENSRTARDADAVDRKGRLEITRRILMGAPVFSPVETCPI